MKRWHFDNCTMDTGPRDPKTGYKVRPRMYAHPYPCVKAAARFNMTVEEWMALSTQRKSLIRRAADFGIEPIPRDEKAARKWGVTPEKWNSMTQPEKKSLRYFVRKNSV